MRFSHLRKLMLELFVPELGLDLHCTSFRRERGGNVGCYWITQRGRTIWRAPENMDELLSGNAADSTAPEITAFLRTYLQSTPQTAPSEPFPELSQILIVADRRTGKRSLQKLSTVSETVDSLLAERLRIKSG